MKKIISIFLVLVLTLGLVACGGTEAVKEGGPTEVAATEAPKEAVQTETPKATSEKKKILLGYAINKLDDAGSRQMEALQNSIDQTNSQRDDIEIELTITDAQSNVDQQISDVETLVAKGCDIIVVSCVDAVGSIPALEYAKSNGVTTVEVRGMVSDAIDLSYVGVDEYALSKMWVDYLKKYLEANPEAVLNVGLIYGKAGQTLQLLRHKAIKELAVEMPERVKITVENYCDWDTQIAMATVEDWLQVYPELNCIASASDEMSVGVTNALTSAGTNYDEFMVLSCDGTDTGIQLVKDGKSDIDIKQIYSKRFSLLLEMTLAKFEGTLKDNYYNAGSLALVPLTLETFDEYSTMK